MIKKTLAVLSLFLIPLMVCAEEANNKVNVQTDEQAIEKEQSIQSRVNNIGSKLLNSNKIENRIIFVYDKNKKENLLTIDPTVTSREVVLYDEYYKFIQNHNSHSNQ